MFMFIMATLPSTFILYLWAVLVWQWYNRFCLSEMCLKWQRRSKVPPNARCVPSYERKGWVPPWSFSRAAHRKEMSYWTPLWLEMKHVVFTTLLKVRRSWWGARRSHGVVQRLAADFYDSGTQKLVPWLINVWTMPANMLKNKVMYRQSIHGVAVQIKNVVHD